MTKLGGIVRAVSICAMLCSCVPDTIQFRDTTDYWDYNPTFANYNNTRYSPGFTGYTQGYDGYGDYDDGYGYSYWIPRYYFYTGAHHGYIKYPYPQ